MIRRVAQVMLASAATACASALSFTGMSHPAQITLFVAGCVCAAMQEVLRQASDDPPSQKKFMTQAPLSTDEPSWSPSLLAGTLVAT